MKKKIDSPKNSPRFICRCIYAFSISVCCLLLCLWRPGHIRAQAIDPDPLNSPNSIGTIGNSDAIDAIDAIDTVDTANTADQAQLRSWLNEQVTILFSHNKSPRRFSGPRPFLPRCATPLIRAALKNPELLDEQSRFILYRPTDATYQDSYYGPVKVLVYNTADGHFRIHYTEDNSLGDAVSGSDGLVQTIPSYVLIAANALETSWAKEVVALGYLPPPSSASGSSTGDDSPFDCYIMGLTYYGYSSIDQDNRPYMVIASDYNDFSHLPQNQDPDGTITGDIRVTVAHEFFHAIQYGYTNWDDQWWEENSAVWMEDEVFDQTNDYLHYLGDPYDDLDENGRWDSGEPYYDSLGTLVGRTGREVTGWFDWPFLPLDASSSTYKKAKYQEYGGGLWVKHLAEKYGPDMVRGIFQRGRKLRQQGTKKTNALELIKAEITSRGSSLASELEEFKIKVLTREFEEGKWYPQVWHVGCYQQYPALFDSDTIYDSERGGYAGILNHLSAQYLRFRAPDEMGSVHLRLTRTYGTGSLSCPLLLTTRSGLIQRVNLHLNAATGSGEITLSGFGKDAEFKSIEAVPINISDTSPSDKTSITLKADFKAVPFSSFSLLPGMNLFSPALPAGESLDSYQFLLHYFTPDSLYSMSMYDQQTGQWIRNTLSGDSQSFFASGPSFPLLTGGIYLLNLKTSQTITLPYSSGLTPELRLLRKGLNFFSLTEPVQTTQGQGDNANGLAEDAFRLLQELGEKVSMIKQKGQKDGKWACAYHFFQQPAGENPSIAGGKTSIVDMVQEEMWLRN